MLLLKLFSQVVLSATVLLSNNHNADAFHYAMVSGASAYFDPIQQGWNDTCNRLGPNVTCDYYKEDHPLIDEHGFYFNKTEHVRICAGFIRHLIEKGGVDGIVATCPAQGDGATRTWIQEAADAGIPAVVFDGPHEGPYLSYIGTDEFDVGRSMAKLLKQLRPEGGTYVTAYNGKGPEQRSIGFVEEIEKFNDRDDKAHWIEEPTLDKDELGWNQVGFNDITLDGKASVIPSLEIIARSNPTAILLMYQTPLRNEGFPDFVGRVRDKNITILGTDGNANNLKLVSRGLVDGLIGQQTYGVGAGAAKTIHAAVSKGRNAVPPIVKTRMINYNLVPDNLPPHEIDQHLLENLKYVGFVCFAIIGSLSMYFIGWTFFNRNSKVIKASQPFFLVMIAFGVLTLAGALIPLSFDNNDSSDISESKAVGICMSVPWLAFHGFGITFSAMFAKTWRVNKFFKSSQTCGRIEVSEKDVLGPAAVVFLLNSIVLICWTVIDPLTYAREFELGTDLYNRDLASKGFCRSDNAAAYLIPLGLINLGLLIITCYQAWEARDIKSEFAESKWIGLAVFSMSQGFLTGIPIVSAVANDQPETFYLTLTLLLFVICLMVLLLIFLPKIMMHHRYMKMSPSEKKKALAASIRASTNLSFGGIGSGSASVRFRLAAAAAAAEGSHGYSDTPSALNDHKSANVTKQTEDSKSRASSGHDIGTMYVKSSSHDGPRKTVSYLDDDDDDLEDVDNEVPPAVNESEASAITK